MLLNKFLTLTNVSSFESSYVSLYRFVETKKLKISQSSTSPSKRTSSSSCNLHSNEQRCFRSKPIIKYGHLQNNARAIVITLQRGRIRAGEWGAMLNEVTFEGYFEGTNADQLRGLPLVHPNWRARRHARWLEGQGPNILQNFGRNRCRYITLTMERILQFLDMS